MTTAIAARRQELAARVLCIEQEKFLDRLEEALVDIEMRERVEESMQAIDRGDVISLDDFHRSNLEWLKENATK